MNLQQLEYIVAIDTHRHFGRAAKSCFVSQPTLSAMVQKLEEELQVKIFDRSKKPVVPTEIGEAVVAQARRVLREVERIKEQADDHRKVLAGELHLGIIPTLAPYLVPLFLKKFIQKYPGVKLKISEHITEDIIGKLKSGRLDAAILVSPLQQPAMREYVLFYEPFLVYSSRKHEKEYLLPEDIDPNQLWLLEEGHCFRTQIANLCELWKQSNPTFEYAAGSIETLKRLVETQNGITVLPYLATLQFTPAERAKLRRFAPPIPVREVSLVTHRDHLKHRLIKVLFEQVKEVIPPELKEQPESYKALSIQEK
jgi:LysR family hydrogen peroxide-inducible transcriptional activator